MTKPARKPRKPASEPAETTPGHVPEQTGGGGLGDSEIKAPAPGTDGSRD